MKPAPSSLLLAALALSLTADAQPPTRTKPIPTRQPAAASEATTQLPVTRVSLYKNGVGFFEHSGHVTGSQSVTIDFTTAQLNDVLQSLTAIDLNGGRIAGAGYNSTTPLDQQLKSLPLGLDQDPTTVDFYNAIRGARVEVRTGASIIIGRLLNIEVVNTPASSNQPAVQRRLITVIGDSGEVRTLELTPATTVRLLDPDLHTDVTRYLQLLASTRNQGLRHLTLQDNGTGIRNLIVSYISEVPIWKSTYRILFTAPKPVTAATSAPATPAANQTATLQGWSVVDNTTGADWNNVQLSLIAGAPQSFIQPLSQPIYSRRPVIPISQQAQLTPQTHESGDVVAKSRAQGSTIQSSGGLQQGVYGGAGQARLNENYIEGISVSNINSQNISAAPPPPNAGLGGTIENELYTNAPLSMGGSPNYQQVASKSLGVNSTTAAFDDFFAYNLTDPITIRKNESALVPILQTRIDAERVTLWSLQHPLSLRALWITNTSNLTLDRGSFSIVEDGNFGGEGLLEPLHPAEKRLLSYAVDQAVRVTSEIGSNSTRVTSISATKGVLILHNTEGIGMTYTVHNAAPEPRTVILELTIHQRYILDSGGQDPKPEETTPTLYRYRVLTAPNETVRLRVGEHRESSTTYQLTSSNDTTLTYILNQTSHNPALEAALQPVFAARRRVADAQSVLDKVNARLTSLSADEDRQRANVTALAAAAKSSRDRFVHDLNTTEDQMNVARRDQAAAEAALQSAQSDLSARIESLQLDEKL